jgi:hydrogenase assembly chaperone HypC/HupF
VERETNLPDSYCTLDHDDCIVCSDAGIPLQVVSIEGDDALCEDAAGNRTEIAVDLVDPVKTGEIVLTHGGVAIAKVQKADKLQC